MFRRWTYRLYPDKTQTQALDDMLEAYRSLYNAALQERRDAWKRCQKSINYYDQANQLKEIRANGDELGRFSYAAAQQVLRRLEKTFKAFFSRAKQGKGGGFPRFKPARRFRSVPFDFGDGATFKNGRLRLVGVGPIKVKWHRPIPSEAKTKQVLIKRDSMGHWHACFTIEFPDAAPILHNGPAIGIDLGLSALVTTSTGEKVAPPQYFRKAQKKMRRQQRRVSRRKKFSRGWRKAQRLVAKTHAHIANQRADFHHKLSHKITNAYSVIAVEDLRTRGLFFTLNKSIMDAGWSYLLLMLSYKAESAGGKFIKVDPRGTSQHCSQCGCHVPKDLSVRVHHCPECGLVLDRDHNAALNILHRALNSPGPGVKDETWAVTPCVSLEAV